MTGTSSSGGIGDTIRKGVGMFHGTGEAIRGNFNATLDKATGDSAAAQKNQAIADQGVNEFEHGYQKHRTGAGVAPGTAESLNTTHSTSTNYGPHSTNAGNKLDPRFDSDMDHRGTATTSTNYGSHSTNTANKLDPRFDSDLDHRGTTTTSTNYGPHSTNVANKLDPTVDSDMDHRADLNSVSNFSRQTDGAGSTNHGPHSTNIANKLDPRVDSDTDHRGTAQSSTNQGPHSTNAANKLDPRVDSDTDHRGATPAFAEKFDPLKHNAAHQDHESLAGVRRGSINGGSELEAAEKLQPPDFGKGDTHGPNTHVHRGSISGGSVLEAAQKLDPARYDGGDESTNYGPHSMNIGNKLDPRVDSDQDHRRCGTREMTARGPGYTQPDPSYHQPRPQPKHQNHVLNMLDPKVESQKDQACPSTCCQNYDLRSSTLPDRRASVPDTKSEAHSTANPHKSDFLNLIDPMVDRNAVKKARASDNTQKFG
ncbi:hypothetical protein P153DRAFT_428342 [Dothidotthia symphoricarpi CBS 119687]|uniref:Uncharacterized protein n=1 Tax=Dothidotthia symphoricarpi CBS 119687 TaxID=1392245 RepID=A0A6A6ANI3_9PLEO|nr:uncharacterized protein P153DRAFT_428342 [Dothidotthia symphoricarpi CBS 119687]KAF2133350.1 hypothetical protein P153DRAFT_428342 [Dothidotthia symphoricarpi CBS 119687]